MNKLLVVKVLSVEIHTINIKSSLFHLQTFYSSPFSLLASLYKIDVRMDNNRLNKSAHPKPSTRNPFTKFAVSRTMAALMTKRNRPNVKIVIGKVRMIRMGFSNALRMASTNENTRAVQKVSI